MEWLYRAKKRYKGLCVLNYMVTFNHIHLLVYDAGGRNVIPDSIKLIAGRTGQEFNVRKKRSGAFWEDRYHATAIDSERYLLQCITYIDMNMVRAGVVTHPSQWEFCGYNEIQNPRKRKGIIDFERLMQFLRFDSYVELRAAHLQWIEGKLQGGPNITESKWTESIAVGSEAFIEKFKKKVKFRAKGRKITRTDDTFELREIKVPYEPVDKMEGSNTFLWNNRKPT